MGGAYGGFARFGDSSGRFLFMSYRDPNLSKTLDIYDSAPEYLKSAEISEEDVLQTVIGCTGYFIFTTHSISHSHTTHARAHAHTHITSHPATWTRR